MSTFINISYIMNCISDPFVRQQLNHLLGMLPGYFWEAPASTSGKYHPEFAREKCGLARHTIVVAFFASRIADSWGLSDYEKDVLLCAALLHDGFKEGTGDDGGHTVHEHPLLMAHFLRHNMGYNGFWAEVAQTIETHMGKWATSKYSDVVLPLSETKLQLALQAADMIAATKQLSFDFHVEA